MRIPNNKIIQQAMRNAVAKLGSQAELGNRAGILQKDISRYISGSGKSFTPQVWGGIYKHIQEFLPENYTENVVVEGDDGNSINLIGYNHGTIVVHSIAGLTTAKEIKSDLTVRILANDEIDEKTKFKIIKLLNEE